MNEKSAPQASFAPETPMTTASDRASVMPALDGGVGAGSIVARLIARNRSDGREVAQPDTLADEAAAEITRLRSLTDWRPIESAPKDGTEFQAWVGQWETRCRYNEDGAFQTWGRVDYDMDGWDYPRLEPTHWLPLPEPPKGGTVD